MQKEEAIRLLHRCLSGQASAAEQRAVQTWEATSEANRAEANAIRRVWAAAKPLPFPEAIDLDADFAALRAKQAARKVPVRKIRRFSWMRVAAAVLVLCAAGALSTWYANRSAPWTETYAAAGVEQIELPDGTQVWLNQGTTLRYPTAFDDEARPVELSGEAFFEVAKDAARPFTVESQNLVVRVLGTAFSVSEATADRPAGVVVREGKVRVRNADGTATVELTAHQTARLSADGQTLTTGTSAGLNELAWQRGSLRFEEAPLRQALSDISRAYGVSVTLDNPTLADCLLSGRYRQDTPLDSLLQSIQLQFDITLRRQPDGGYALSGGRCR